MGSLEIHDSFEPYYADRKPFKQDQRPLKERERTNQKDGSAAPDQRAVPTADANQKAN